jgi:hypothetical protein
LARHIENPVTLACWLGGTAMTAIMGPFGTYASMEALPRAIYFGAVLMLSIVIAYLARVMIAEWMPPMPRMRQDLIMPPLFAALFTPLLQVVNGDLLRWNADNQEPFIVLFLFNMIVAAGIGGVRQVLGFDFLSGRVEPVVAAMAAVAETGIDETQAQAQPRLYTRLEQASGRVLRLTVADHYVIVVMDDGSRERLLMRFGDAVAELDGQDGFLTHRSHWVSAHAVKRAVRVSGRDALELADGSVVPVSRTYRGDVEARGYLADPVGLALASE